MITIRNRQLQAAFDEHSGAWIDLQFVDGDLGSLIQRPGPAFDLRVDGAPLWGDEPRTISGHTITDDGRGVSITYDRDGLRLIHGITLDPIEPLLRQRVQIDVIDGPARTLTAVEYFLPGLAIGDPIDCFVQAPATIIPPDSSYAELASKPLDRSWSEPLPWFPHGWLDYAPDGASGLVAIENRQQRRIGSAWLHSDVATSFSTIDGDGDRITVAQRHQIAAWLKPGVSVRSDGMCVLLTAGSWTDHLLRFRSIAYNGWPIAANNAPAWLDDARLFQIDPRPITTWTAKLDQLREMGFTLLYLMPIWHNQGNWYALLDHYSVDHRVGTVDEVRQFVAAAHERGMKVIFDFIPQGIGVHSPFVQQHPEWLARDEGGRPFASHGWGPKAGEPATEGTWSLDWGRPDYRAWILDWARWNLQTFDIDGWRTDALQWKEPNFAPDNPYPAYQTMFGGVQLGRELYDQIKAAKPDAILFSELGGPIFQQMHDATYDNGWLLSRVNQGWLKADPYFTGAQWTRILADSEAARPPGTPRTPFTANHDSPQIAELARNSPWGNTVSFIHAFTAGFPFITWLEVDGREAFFADLMGQRARLTGYRCIYDRAQPDSLDLFTALWIKPGDDAILAVANPSTAAVDARIELAAPIEAATVRWGTDGTRVSAAQGDLMIELGAGGYALIELHT